MLDNFEILNFYSVDFQVEEWMDWNRDWTSMKIITGIRFLKLAKSLRFHLQNFNVLKSLTIYQQLLLLCKIYLILSLWRLPNQCHKRGIMILREHFLMFGRVHSSSCDQGHLFKHRFFAALQRFRMRVIYIKTSNLAKS